MRSLRLLRFALLLCFSSSCTGFQWSLSSITVPETGLEQLKVSWSWETANPSWLQGDLIALYCPPRPIPNGEAPLDALVYFPVDNATQNQVFINKLVNMRCDYQLHYLTRDGPGWRPTTAMMEVVATSPVVLQEGKDSPMQEHLEPLEGANRHDGVRLIWIQGETCHAVRDLEFFVELRVADNASAPSRRVSARSYSYGPGDLGGPPANIAIQSLWREPGCFHSAELHSLLPNTKYVYTFGCVGAASGDVTAGNKTRQSYFHSPPARGAFATPTKFIYFADQAYNDDPTYRSYKTSSRVAEDVRLRGFSLVTHGGDLSYSMGFANFWEHWGHMVTQYAAHAPYAISAGNHEIDGPHSYSPAWGNFDDDSGGEGGIPTRARFPNLEKTFYYSFDHGLVHIAVLCTEVDISPGSRQHEWLVADLRSVDRTATPWTAVIGHRPIVASMGPDYDPMAQNVTDHLHKFVAPVLAQFNVDLGLWGHYHHYERFEATATGTTNLIVGTAGADLDSGIKWLPTSVKHVSDWGYLRLIAHKTTLTAQFVLNRDGSIFDEFRITK